MRTKLRLYCGAALVALSTVGCGAGKRGHPKAVDPSVMAVPAGLPGSTQPRPPGPNRGPGMPAGPMAMMQTPGAR